MGAVPYLASQILPVGGFKKHEQSFDACCRGFGEDFTAYVIMIAIC